MTALWIASVAVAYLAGILTAWWERRAEEKHVDEPVRRLLGAEGHHAVTVSADYMEHVDQALAAVEPRPFPPFPTQRSAGDEEMIRGLDEFARSLVERNAERDLEDL